MSGGMKRRAKRAGAAFAAILLASAAMGSPSRGAMPRQQTPSDKELRDLLPAGDTIIVAPQPVYSWRVGAGGKIERSTDESRTWQTQKSGVTTDLLAGSAVSGKVCWVVGKAGTVLLTTDRGSHWKKLTAPTQENLVGVNAMDEKKASVWIAGHTKSYETDDGGVTWKEVVNQ